MRDADHKSLFMTWLGEHGSSVVKVARAYTLTSEECQDLAQEILLQAWRSLPKFEEKASAATWFYRVALHTAMNCPLFLLHGRHFGTETGGTFSAMEEGLSCR